MENFNKATQKMLEKYNIDPKDAMFIGVGGSSIFESETDPPPLSPRAKPLKLEDIEITMPPVTLAVIKLLHDDEESFYEFLDILAKEVLNEINRREKLDPQKAYQIFEYESTYEVLFAGSRFNPFDKENYDLESEEEDPVAVLKFCFDYDEEKQEATIFIADEESNLIIIN